MDQLVARLREYPSVRIEDRDEAWKVSIDNAQHTFVVIIPFTVPEWFVDVFDDRGTLIWQDWVDYAGYSDVNDMPAIATEMGGDIERFVARSLTAQEFQVHATGKVLKQTRALWKQGDAWEHVWTDKNDADAK